MTITAENNQSQELYFLIYTSYAASGNAPELTALLRQARENNKGQDITGMLLYMNGIFIQLIEGAPLSVMPLYRKICADTRHKGVITLKKGFLEKRYFQDWSMAFKAVSAQELAEEESYQCLNAPSAQNVASVLQVFDLLSSNM